MSNKTVRRSKPIGPLGASPAVRKLISFLSGLIVLGAPAILNAQDAAPTVTTPTPALSTPAAAPTTASGEYLISPDDVLDVYVYDVPEISHAYTVSPSGGVTVPLLPEPVPAAGLTPDQFARALEKAFRESGRLRRPEIAVSVKESRTLSLTVDGAVRNRKYSPKPDKRD